MTLEIRRDGEITALPITIGESTNGGRRVGLIGITPVNKPIETGRTAQDMLTLQKYGAIAARAATRRPRPGIRRCSRCASSAASSPAMFL